MKVTSKFRIVYFMLIGICSHLACNSKPSESTGSAPDASVSSNIVLPPPTAYASDKEGWLVNLNEAYAKSLKENKLILANFTGSDWNAGCKKLYTDVFSTPVFKAWADKNVVLLEIDFPKRKQLPKTNQDVNAAMAQSLKVTSYPAIWILKVTRTEDNSGFKVKPMGTVVYEQSPEKFMGALQNFVLR